MKIILIAGSLGLVLGAIVSKYLFVGSWLNLILWGVFGVGIGFYAGKLRAALVAGAIYGFVLSFSFMMAGYEGTMSRASRILPFSVLGLFGAICGVILAVIGYLAAKKFRKPEPASTIVGN